MSLAATVRPAPELGPGRAYLFTDAPVPDGFAVTVVNEEAETNRYLGPAGWQATRAEFPLVAEPHGAGSRALLGPAVCDFIGDAQYIVLLFGETRIFEDFWPKIAPSGLRGAASGIVASGRRDEPPSASIRRVPVEDAGLERVDNGANAVPALPASAPAEPTVAPGRSRTPLLMTLGGLSLLLLVCGAAAFFWLQRQSGDIAAIQSPEAPAAPAPLPSPAPNAAGTDGDLALGAEGWRRLIGDPATAPERLLHLGMDLRRRDPETAEIGFEAIYEASRRGNADASKWYARANDPTLALAPGDTVPAPNVRRALELYARAGERTTNPDLARVCDHLRAKRFSGSVAERTSFQDFCS